MFDFLSQDSKPTGKKEHDFLADITADLEVMFQKGEAASEPKKPTRKAPKPPKATPSKQPTGAGPAASAGGGGGANGPLSRTQRRQRRVIKKLLGVEEEAHRRDEVFDPKV